MDATERPLKVPPEFSIYAEKYHIFEVFQQILTALIIKKPDDPLPFISDYLKRMTDEAIVPRILILGPPKSGKTTVSGMLSKAFGCQHVKEQEIFTPDVLESRGVSVPTELPVPDWVELVKRTLESLEDSSTGWIMDGIVPSRQHALFLCATGYFPSHTVVLKAPTGVLMSREFDAKDLRFMAPQLQEGEDAGDQKKAPRDAAVRGPSLESRINGYCLRSKALVSTYGHTAREVNADQPLEDVYARVLEFVSQPKRVVAAPHTPRVILFGPVGSGKDTLAKMFHAKYKINTISYENLKMHEISKETKLGEIFKLSSETCTPEPSEAKFDLVRNELDNLEHPSRGWILYGYPTNRVEAEYLHAADYEPNRVFFLDAPNDRIVERLTLQGLDPLTGKAYHVTGSPPENERIKNRLEVHPDHTLEKVCLSITTYRENESSLRDFYRDVSFRIDADLEPDGIFETVESIVVNPLPIKVKVGRPEQDPAAGPN